MLKEGSIPPLHLLFDIYIATQLNRYFAFITVIQVVLDIRFIL